MVQTRHRARHNTARHVQDGLEAAGLQSLGNIIALAVLQDHLTGAGDQLQRQRGVPAHKGRLSNTDVDRAIVLLDSAHICILRELFQSLRHVRAQSGIAGRARVLLDLPVNGGNLLCDLIHLTDLRGQILLGALAHLIQLIDGLVERLGDLLRAVECILPQVRVVRCRRESREGVEEPI